MLIFHLSTYYFIRGITPQGVVGHPTMWLEWAIGHPITVTTVLQLATHPLKGWSTHPNIPWGGQPPFQKVRGESTTFLGVDKLSPQLFGVIDLSLWK
jgi:hypothetical protein